jgi:hypothetical protein
MLKELEKGREKLGIAGGTWQIANSKIASGSERPMDWSVSSKKAGGEVE